jgi:hypothetical protein
METPVAASPAEPTAEAAVAEPAPVAEVAPVSEDGVLAFPYVIVGGG